MWSRPLLAVFLVLGCGAPRMAPCAVDRECGASMQCVAGACQTASGGLGGGIAGVGGGSFGAAGGAGGGCTRIASVGPQNHVGAFFSSNPDAGFESLGTLAVLSRNPDAGTGVFAFATRDWSRTSARPTFPESFTLRPTEIRTCLHCLFIRACRLDLSVCGTEGYLAQSGSGTWTAGTFNTAAGSFAGSIRNAVYSPWNFTMDRPSSTGSGCIEIGAQDFNETWP